MTPSLPRRHFLRASALALTVAPLRGLAADDPAVARIRSFYDALLESMKSAKNTPAKARYRKLEAPVRATFDLAAMTRIAVGPAWTSFAAEDQAALVEQFSRFTIATYASRFDGWSGEKFEVDDAAEARGANQVVKSRLVKSSGEPVVLDYLMHPVADGWKVIDVYLSGAISELATRRSDFGALIRSGGAKALSESLTQRADTMLGS